MIFIEGFDVIDTGKLPEKPRKESWTDGERFKMIFTKAVKEVDVEELDRQFNRSSDSRSHSSDILDSLRYSVRR